MWIDEGWACIPGSVNEMGVESDFDTENMGFGN